MAGADLRFDWSWSLPATPEALWPLVSDTNRFNRDTGLPPVGDASRPDDVLANARRRLRMRALGIALEWEELPFEWLRPWRFGVVRRYSRGFLEEMRVLVTLEPDGEEATRLRYQVVARPRGLLGGLVARVQIGILGRQTFARVFREYGESARGVRVSAPADPVRLRPPYSGAAVARLEAAGVGAELAGRIVEHAWRSDDMSAARMRPYALARIWGLPRRDVLVGFMEATRAGLLDLSWEVLCPQCRGAKREADTLRRLRTGNVHCETCRIDFSPDFERWVELAFRPSAAVRRVEASPFCVAGPQVTPHVHVQQLMPPGETRVVAPILEPGRYGVRAIGAAGGPTLEVAVGGAAEGMVVLGEGGWSVPAGPIAPEPRLRLVNDTDAERLFAVERAAWADDTVTAAEVTAMPEFRDLFSGEVLAAGEFMGVGSLAVLFTDLKESTLLYRSVGDAPAFGRVMRHFEVLEDVVEREGGTVVKTIGDAVMAVFPQPEDGMRAALDAHDALREASGSLVLKAGLHYGPCLAVTLNDRLDYFGTSVNVAARLGALSEGDDLVVSDAVWNDDAVRALLAESAAVAEPVAAELKGLEGPMQVWRVSARPGEGA